MIATGRPASPGAVTGKVVFTAEEAEKRAAAGDAVILVRNETSPEDSGGMHAAQGILTATGGMTSHAAVVARGMGKCCVAGAGTVRIDYDAERFTAGDVVVKAGDVISLDGTAGEVLLGADLVRTDVAHRVGGGLRHLEHVERHAGDCTGRAAIKDNPFFFSC